MIDILGMADSLGLTREMISKLLADDIHLKTDDVAGQPAFIIDAPVTRWHNKRVKKHLMISLHNIPTY